MDRLIRHSRRATTPSAKALPQFAAAKSRAIDRLQDAVYREMYRLEAQLPGSEMGLALALLRVIVASQQQIDDRDDFGNWLKEICPIVLKMIEDGLDRRSECPPAPK